MCAVVALRVLAAGEINGSTKCYQYDAIIIGTIESVLSGNIALGASTDNHIGNTVLIFCGSSTIVCRCQDINTFNNATTDNDICIGITIAIVNCVGVLLVLDIALAIAISTVFAHVNVTISASVTGIVQAANRFGITITVNTGIDTTINIGFSMLIDIDTLNTNDSSLGAALDIALAIAIDTASAHVSVTTSAKVTSIECATYIGITISYAPSTTWLTLPFDAILATAPLCEFGSPWRSSSF